MGLPIFLFGLKWTTVHVCSISDGKCQIATDEKFVGANGITVNKDGSLVFVNDPSEKLVTVFQRDDDFQLIKESVIQVLNSQKVFFLQYIFCYFCILAGGSGIFTTSSRTLRPICTLQCLGINHGLYCRET